MQSITEHSSQTFKLSNNGSLSYADWQDHASRQTSVRGRIVTLVIPFIANLPISLIDHITKAFRSAGKIDARNLSSTKSDLPDSGTASESRCVKQLFAQASEGLAREAYCFRPADLNAANLDRPSFKQFQKQWEREGGKSGKGDGRFPEVRKGNGIEPFSRCVLRCMCDPCLRGEAAKLQCDTYDFGNEHTVRALPLG